MRNQKLRAGLNLHLAQVFKMLGDEERARETLTIYRKFTSNEIPDTGSEESREE